MTQNIFAESKVGWILTNGSPTGERNTLAGVDFNYSTSRFLGNKNLMVAVWAAYNWNEQKEGRHHGFGFRAKFPNDLWNVETTYAYYGEALDPGLGYMMRKSIQTFYVRASYQPRPRAGFLGGLVRQFFFQSSVDYYWDLAGRLESRRVTLVPLSFRTESGEQLPARGHPQPRRPALPVRGRPRRRPPRGTLRLHERPGLLEYGDAPARDVRPELSPSGISIPAAWTRRAPD